VFETRRLSAQAWSERGVSLLGEPELVVKIGGSLFSWQVGLSGWGGVWGGGRRGRGVGQMSVEELWVMCGGACKLAYMHIMLCLSMDVACLCCSGPGGVTPAAHQSHVMSDLAQDLSFCTM
jgi:hypothetical protein